MSEYEVPKLSSNSDESYQTGLSFGLVQKTKDEFCNGPVVAPPQNLTSWTVWLVYIFYTIKMHLIKNNHAAVCGSI